MLIRVLRFVAPTALALFVLATPLVAQPNAKRKAAAAVPALTGTWTGTATVALGDSTIMVPVIYTFTETAGAIGGTAVVPGQATGTVSNVSRSGSRVQFRVSPKEGKPLEHDGTFAANGALEGTVSMDGEPVAMFKITPKPPTAPK